MHGDFLIEEGQTLSVTIADHGLGGRALSIRTEELDPVSGERVSITHIETDISPNIEIRTSYEETINGTEVSVSKQYKL